MRVDRIRRGILLFLLISSPVLACSDLGPGEAKGPGAIHVDLVSPNGAEGSAVFQMAGGMGLGEVTSFGGEVFYNHDYGSETSRVVVILDTPGQIQFKIRTADVRELPEITLIQVADGSDDLRISLDGYRIERVQVEDEGRP
jgi:hypothetical protein